MDKSEILGEFSSEPQRYYAVDLFEEKGFMRRSCSVCGRFFWTLDAARTACPDDGSDTYSFIGDPPTSSRFDYAEAWRQIESFFVENGHTSIGRYPVVCRWRDDLYFTIASIVDFQRVMGSKVVFEFPANPLVVPQTCLRFKDLENVGVTGRHFSSFCMVGQHSVQNIDEIESGDNSDGGYWKDKCIDLDYRMLTGRFGIRPEEIVFVEDVWEGGGSFGPSLEYFVRGLELGNAVFTQFQGELGRHTELDRRIIDMGAGLERFAWITMGTPTAYDCCFGKIGSILQQSLGIDTDAEILRRYYTEVARRLEGTNNLQDVRRQAMSSANISEDIARRLVTPIEGAYLIADHLRTLIFAIADGALPSNVGGGYNLRIMIRRVSEAMRRLGLPQSLHADELVDAHIDYLQITYPELDDKRNDVKKILAVETGRYAESRMHMQKKVARLQRRGEPSVNDMITLYESDGITPEYLVEEGVIVEVPPEFYTKLSELHQAQKQEKTREISLDGIPETEMLFYGDDPFEFDATVLWSDKDMVVLDRTSFYARGGGQEPDRGSISGLDVTDVEKHAGIIVHRLAGRAPQAGQRVKCALDVRRRTAITKNHTATHILNASSRSILGSWVWQHSAFKDEDHARLDITHHSALTGDQVRQIEETANKMVADDLVVSIQYMDRGTAEQRYGFKIYQGGIVPVKSVRIVSISNQDVEACGGTHVRRTSQVEKIKITRTKRIQDGVVRLEFVSGGRALEYEIQQRAAAESKASEAILKEQARVHRLEEREKTRQIIPDIIRRVSEANSDVTIEGIKVHVAGTIKACIMTEHDKDEHFHTSLGKKMTKEIPNSAYVGVFKSDHTVRLVAYVGKESVSVLDATRIIAESARVLGGGVGGDATFSQGGGTKTSKIKDAAVTVELAMLGMLTDAGLRDQCG